MIRKNFSVLKVAMLEKVVAITVFTCIANSATGTRIVKYLKAKMKVFEKDQLFSW